LAILNIHPITSS